jgi:hypothetical protein
MQQLILGMGNAIYWVIEGKAQYSRSPSTDLFGTTTSTTTLD